MQRDTKGRFTSTDEKRKASDTITKVVNKMQEDLRDLARLEAAEAFLIELESSDIWDEIGIAYARAKAEILKPFLTAPESELFQ